MLFDHRKELVGEHRRSIDLHALIRRYWSFEAQSRRQWGQCAASTADSGAVVSTQLPSSGAHSSEKNAAWWSGG